MRLLLQTCLLLIALLTSTIISASELGWPMRCPDGSEQGCLIHVWYPDVDGDGRDSACEPVNRRAHTGTDLVPSLSATRAGVNVVAAAAGKVVFAEDQKFDQCPADHPECRPASLRKIRPGFSGGYTTCTNQGQFCSDGQPFCFWCFSGNYVVIEHDDNFTAYLHLKQGSVSVAVGDEVDVGDVVGAVGSSGNSDGPHLHFEVWQDGLFKPVDPWQGICGDQEAPWKRDLEASNDSIN